MTGRTITLYKDVEIDVDVDLSDFETSDLLEELKAREALPGMTQDDMTLLIDRIAVAIQLRLPIITNKLLEELIYNATGKVVSIPND